MGSKQRTLAKKPIHFEALEPRILFSAGIEGAFAADALADSATYLNIEDESYDIDLVDFYLSSADNGSLTQTRELAFIDTQVDDYQLLLNDILEQAGEGRQIEVVVLDSDRNGLNQINETLDQYNDISAVHIISHGSEGEIQLGNQTFNNDSLEANQASINNWKNTLSDDADILLYGCNLAGNISGENFISSLAELSGADVAASTDLTGNSVSGGDWELEHQSGVIESHIALTEHAQNSWEGILPDVNHISYETVSDPAEIKSDQNWGQTFSHTSGSGSYSVNQLSVQLQKDSDASAQTITVSLQDAWGGTVLGSNSITTSELSTSMNWVDFDLTNVALNDGQTYFIRVTSDSVDGKVHVGHDSSSSFSGDLINKDGVTESGKDMAFRVSNALFTVFDKFDNGYSGNDGNQNWTSDWVESDLGSGAGNIKVAGTQLMIQTDDTGDNIYREADLSGATTATLTFDVDNQNLSNNDTVRVEVSGNGGGTWTTLKDYTSANQGTASENFDISAYIASDTQVRIFVIDGGSNKTIKFDNIQIEYNNGVSNAAVITGNTSFNGNEGDTVSGVLNATDVDGLTDNTYFSVSSAATNGTAIIDAITGAWSLTPTDANWFGTDNFTVAVTDDLGGTTTQLVSITLANVNDAPVAINDHYSTNEDTTLTDNLLDNDTDTEGNTLSVSSELALNPSHGLVTLNANGTFSYIPNQNFEGSDEFVYEISDGMGGTATATVSINVNSVNDAPLANDASFEIESLISNGTVVGQFIASDADAGSTLNYQIIADDGRAAFAIDSQGRVVVADSTQVDQGNSGEVSLTIQVSDEKGVNSQAQVIIQWSAIQDGSTDIPTTTIDTQPNEVQVKSNSINSESSNNTKIEALTTKSLLLNAQNAISAINTSELGPLNAINIESVLTNNSELWAQIDAMTKQIEENQDSNVTESIQMIEVATGVTGTLTAGFVTWALRGGSLMASIISVAPLWREFDPMPILSHSPECSSDKNAKDSKRNTAEPTLEDFFK